MATDRSLKAWLNYNCDQSNNWIVQYKFEEIANHSDRECLETQGGGTKQPTTLLMPFLSASDLRHILFTYMTESLMITLVEMSSGKLYLIHNKLTINESDQAPDPTLDPVSQETTTTTQTIVFDDAMIDNYGQDPKIKKVEMIESLPQIQSVKSKITQLRQLTDLTSCLSSKELKAIGLRPKKWLECTFKKTQQDELKRLHFLDFTTSGDAKIYVTQFDDYVKQSGTCLNLTHNYSVTPELLGQLTINSQITEVVMVQNFQIHDFAWLKVFPNLKLLNFWYCHQIEQRQIAQIVEYAPQLEVFNLHASCRVNIRLLLPLFSLTNLQKLAIDDPSFWCQKSIHELFILPREWANVSCPTLTKLAINSTNLTLDVLDYIIRACPNLQQIVLDDQILNMVSRNLVAGRDQELLAFHAWGDPRRGCQVPKRVSFKNMFKDTHNSEMFSQSMLKKIKEHRERNHEPEPIPIIAKGEENLI